MRFAKVLGRPILKNICERLLLHRGCGCGVDEMKRTRQTHWLNNKTQVAKERADLGLNNLTGNLF